MRLCKRVECKFLCLAPALYPYPPLVLLPAICWAITLCAKVYHQTHSIINRHMPLRPRYGASRTEGPHSNRFYGSLRYFRFVRLSPGHIGITMFQLYVNQLQRDSVTLIRQFLHPMYEVIKLLSRVVKVILKWWSSQHSQLSVAIRLYIHFLYIYYIDTKTVQCYNYKRKTGIGKRAMLLLASLLFFTMLFWFWVH